MRALLLLLLTILSAQSATWSGWKWDWAVRQDGGGHTNGYYGGDTPFPVTESTTTYTITNESGNTTLTVGTIYFVDNTLGATTATYNPATRLGTGGSQTAYTTVSNALAAVTAGNKTILVRSGTYVEGSLVLLSGTDSTHRFSIIGYNQERPIINATNAASDCAFSGVDKSFWCLQRLKLINARESAVFGNRSGSALIADVWSYWSNYLSTLLSDGHFVFTKATNSWAYHCTAERGYGHCFKMSDGCTGSLTEFCQAIEAGWYSGATTNSLSGHPVGFDYPDTAHNHELRYSFVRDALFNAIQVRGLTNASGGGTNGVGLVKIHHNEIANNVHFEDVIGEAGHDTEAQVIFNQGYRIGVDGTVGLSNIVHFYGNIVRDSGDTATRGVRVYAPYDAVYIYDNVICGNDHYELEITSGHVGSCLVWGNSFYDSDSSEEIVRCISSSTPDFKNNVFYQAGAANAVLFSTGTHTYNQYYFPSASRGTTLGTGEADGNPSWTSIPSGEWSAGEAAPAIGSPLLNVGTTMSSLFSDDFLSVALDGTPDIGAIQYVDTASTFRGFQFGNGVRFGGGAFRISQ